MSEPPSTPGDDAVTDLGSASPRHARVDASDDSPAAGVSGDSASVGAPASSDSQADAADGTQTVAEDDAQWVSASRRGRLSGAEPGEPQPVAGDPAETGRVDPDSHAADVLRWRRLSKERNAERRDTFSAKSGHRKKWPWYVELPVLLLTAFLVTFLVQTFIARVYYVPSGSMEQTLHGVEHGGDRILAYKLGYDFGSPEQGDVVVFRGPSTWPSETVSTGATTILGRIGQMLGAVVGIAPPNEKDFVKRVIAVGGQTISCCDEQGRTQVNGISLDEPYLFMDVEHHSEWAWIDGESSCQINPSNPTHFLNIRCFGPYTVPEGEVWVMGDHRSDSADSSYGCRGVVPSEEVRCQGPVPVKDIIGRAVAIVMPPSRWGGVGSPDIMPSEDPPSGAATSGDGDPGAAPTN